MTTKERIEFKTHKDNKVLTIKTFNNEKVIKYLNTWKNMEIPNENWEHFAKREHIKYEII